MKTRKGKGDGEAYESKGRINGVGRTIDWGGEHTIQYTDGVL